MKAMAALAVGLAQLFGWAIDPPSPSRSEVADCLSRDVSSVRRAGADSVFFCGRITSASVGLLRDTLQINDRTLMISSFGGEVDAPLRMAELVRDRALRVVAVGPCLSGCASFVFVAGRQRTVARGGVLGLHNTSTSALYLAQVIQGQAASRDGPLRLRAAREQELYRSLDVDLGLLMEPQARLDTVCVEIGAPDARTGETRYLIRSHYGFWVPTREQWRAFGVFFEGQVPVSGNQAARWIDGFTGRSPGDAAIAYNRFSLPAAPAAYLAEVGRCVSPL